jgi:FlgD Ig-like domain
MLRPCPPRLHWPTWTIALLLYAGAVEPTTAIAQCILSNPSFEVIGTAGASFGGWNQFGTVTTSTVADHGAIAAKVTGPEQSSWSTSGVWQRLDTTVGEQWEVRVRLLNESTRPLTGQSIAMVNIEWRDAADALISYDSYPAADANSPVDTWIDFWVMTDPAPTGAVTARLLLGVLEAPNEAAPAIIYDAATFLSVASPTMDEQQWSDFPGNRVIEFAGYDWRVKGPGFYDPGSSNYGDGPNHVWVDALGELHLTIQQISSIWYSTEIAMETPLGYGDYVFSTRGRLDLFDSHTVLGMFLWQYGPCFDASLSWWNPYNEIDIEFSRWNDPANSIGNFTAQPYDWPGNQSTYDPVFAVNEITSHAFRWLPDRLEFRSWRGGSWNESSASTIHAWTYTGPHIPRPEQPRVHLNLWSIFGSPATDQEAVLSDFNFTPEDAATAVGVRDLPPVTMGAPGRLYPATPNPFNPQTQIRYVLERADDIELAIFDLAGRRVRSLRRKFTPAGEHVTVWDGRDDDGLSQATGVYLYRLRTNDFVETRKMTLLK